MIKFFTYIFKILYVLSVAFPLSVFVLVSVYTIYAILDLYQIITKTIKNAKAKFITITTKRVS